MEIKKKYFERSKIMETSKQSYSKWYNVILKKSKFIFTKKWPSYFSKVKDVKFGI